MATSIAKVTELGFAEFASTLISETLNAIVTSMLTQEKQVAQLEQQTQLTPEQYAKENFTDEIVRAEILRLFPKPQDTAGKSAVDEGEPYTPSKETAEDPAIYDKTGYRMTKGDTAVVQGKTVITSAGYAHILAATQRVLAIQHLSVLKTVVARGVPRVYVDNGHITSKLTLRFETGTTAPTTNTTASRIAGVNLPRLVAQPVNANRPEYLTLKADVLSEVEITFKTVIP